MPELRPLIEGFAYDAWANVRWIEALSSSPFEQEGTAILEHIVQAERIWFDRVFGDEQLPPQSGDLAADVRAIGAAWAEALVPADPGAYVVYTNMAGNTYYNTVEQIGRHVINHGTYHRGQLRGLAQAHQWTGYPETDLILYYRENPVETV